jgi:hypothetical protein
MPLTLGPGTMMIRAGIVSKSQKIGQWYIFSRNIASG